MIETCANVTVCPDFMVSSGSSAVVSNISDTAASQATCCVYNTTATCVEVNATCTAGKVPVKPSSTKVNGTVQSAALDKCCVAPTCDNTNAAGQAYTCTGLLVAGAATAAFNASWDTEDKEEACCVYTTAVTCANITCDTGYKADATKASTLVNGSSPDTAHENCCEETCAVHDCPVNTVDVAAAVNTTSPTDDKCCAYPANATCASVTGTTNASVAVAFTCDTGSPKVVATGGDSPIIAALSPAAAATECCEVVTPVVYLDAWLEDEDNANATKAKCFTASTTTKVATGAATIVEGSATGCDNTTAACLAGGGTVTAYYNTDCSYATFVPADEDCEKAVGKVTWDTATGVMTSIAGTWYDSDDDLSVTKVEGQAKQVNITKGSCSAKFTLADGAFTAVGPQPPKQSAAFSLTLSKATSLAAAVVALLAMLLL